MEDDGLFFQPVRIAVQGVGIQAVVDAVVFGGFVGEVAQFGGDLQRTGPQVGRQVGDGREVADVCLRPGRERDRPEDARQAEHVLCLQKGSVRVAVHLHGHGVPAVLVQVGRDVERGRVAGVLGEAYVAAVYPEVEKGIHAVKVQEDFLPGPVVRQGEIAAVGADLVAVNVGRPVAGRRAHDATAPVVRPDAVLEDHLLVDVYRHAVFQRSVRLDAVDVPVHRHGHVVPAGEVLLRVEEVLRAFLGRFGPVEFPGPVQREPAVGMLGQQLPGLFGIPEREEIGARQFLVEREVAGRLPLVAARRGFHVVPKAFDVLRHGRLRMMWNSFFFIVLD